jgi:ribosomal protein S14
MCMIDDGEGHVTMLSEADPVARKAHECKECGREIALGERYHVDRFIWERKLVTHKVCAHCMVARQWLRDECGGWLFGAVEEDIREHAHSGDYPMGVHRLAVGMAWKWRTPTGKLLPVPKVPQTTHERIHAV